MPLTNKRIAALAEWRGVDAAQVTDFLESLAHTEGRRSALASLTKRARAGRWNSATVAAIHQGIDEWSPAPPKAPPAPRVTKRQPPAVDREWQREQAMQAGMGLGVEAYNEAMGWGSDGDEY